MIQERIMSLLTLTTLIDILCIGEHTHCATLKNSDDTFNLNTLVESEVIQMKLNQLSFNKMVEELSKASMTLDD